MIPLIDNNLCSNCGYIWKKILEKRSIQCPSCRRRNWDDLESIKDKKIYYLSLHNFVILKSIPMGKYASHYSLDLVPFKEEEYEQLYDHYLKCFECGLGILFWGSYQWLEDRVLNERQLFWSFKRVELEGNLCPKAVEEINSRLNYTRDDKNKFFKLLSDKLQEQGDLFSKQER